MELVELVKQFGFPIAVAIYFIWDKGRTEKEHKDDLRNIAVTAIKAIDANTEALNDKKAQDERYITAYEANNVLLNKVSGVLTARGSNNGNGN